MPQPVRRDDPRYAQVLAFGDKTIAGVVVGDATGAVFDAVLGLETDRSCPAGTGAAVSLRPASSSGFSFFTSHFDFDLFTERPPQNSPAGEIGNSFRISSRSGSLNFAIRCAEEEVLKFIKRQFLTLIEGNERACLFTEDRIGHGNHGDTPNGRVLKNVILDFVDANLFAPPRLIRSFFRPSVTR